MRPIWIAAATLAVGCGPKTLEAHLAQAEKRGAEAESLLDEAGRQLDAMRPDKAEGPIGEAKAILTDPDLGYYPERALLEERLKEAERRVVDVRATLARRELEGKLKVRRQTVERALAALKKAIDDLHTPGAGGSQVRAARGAVDDLDSAVKEGKDLEPQDKGYADVARGARKTLADAAAEVRLVEKTVAFQDGPMKAREAAVALLKQAAAEKKDKKKRRELFVAARDKFRTCSDDGKALLAESPELRRAALVTDEGVTSPNTIVAGCAARAVSLDRVMGVPGVPPKRAPPKLPPPRKKRR